MAENASISISASSMHWMLGYKDIIMLELLWPKGGKKNMRTQIGYGQLSLIDTGTLRCHSSINLMQSGFTV